MGSLAMQSESKSFYRSVFSLVLPMALQNLINVAVTSADVIMLGKVGETVLSASSLAGQLNFIMTMFFFGITSGAAVLTAQYWGKRDTKTIERILGITLRLSILVACIFTVVALCFPRTVMMIFSSEEPVIEEGIKYLRIVSVSYLFTSITMVYLNIMRTVERVVISTVVYAISLVTNVVINGILIFGLFGAPKLGIAGAAIGTTIARGVELAIVIGYSCRNQVVRFRLKDLLVHDTELFRDFLKYAIPVTLNEILWGFGSSMNSVIIGHLGQSVVAANSVTQVTRQLAMVIAFGLSNAAAIMLGKTIGAGDPQKALRDSKRFLRLTFLFGLGGAAVILLVSPIARATLTLSETAQGYLTFMMFVMSYFTVAQAMNTTIVCGVLRSGGDAKFGLVLDATTMWGCSILLGAVCAFILKLPVPIVYVVLMSDELIKLPLSFFRYRKRYWLRDVTRDQSQTELINE
ncbi:MAG: MATE family efflux transporter [Massiliimalia sp.]|jgi:putative MATE family efflux protein